jgi:hypothetical protein
MKLTPNLSFVPGLWMQMAQAVAGPSKTVIGIVAYSDKTGVLQGLSCYPVYCNIPNLQVFCYT